ncbi:MAG: ANTAR domain-containing protein [Lachnospiraceae bacterium]|nr:ANTAR domain-containing protein [Lachnospiraceae bacterium]
MHGFEDMRHTVLIVSASAQFEEAARRALTGFVMAESRRSASAARRSFLERNYDLIVICLPLPDEPGEQLALDIAEQSNTAVLLSVPSEVYEAAAEQAAEHGIYVVRRPAQSGALERAVRFLFAVSDRLRRLEKQLAAAEEKTEELRIVSRAKLLLVEKKRMTEDEAHRLIGRYAMNHGVSRRRIAERILDDLE